MSSIAFGFPRSTFVQSVRPVLTYKNVSYSIRNLEAEMGKPTQLALHPFNRVPILQLVDAIRQGLAAHREYERLMSTGMRHDSALRMAVSISTATRDRPIANRRAVSRLNARTTPLMSPAPECGGKLYGKRHEHKFRVAVLLLLLLSGAALMVMV